MYIEQARKRYLQRCTNKSRQHLLASLPTKKFRGLGGKKPRLNSRNASSATTTPKYVIAMITWGTMTTIQCGRARRTARDPAIKATPYVPLHIPSQMKRRILLSLRIAAMEQPATPMKRNTAPAMMSDSWFRSSAGTGSCKRSPPNNKMAEQSARLIAPPIPEAYQSSTMKSRSHFVSRTGKLRRLRRDRAMDVTFATAPVQ